MEHNYHIDYADVALIPLGWSDSINYMELRNRTENRKWFVSKEIISISQQKAWYENYLGNCNDIMFAVYRNESFIGANALYDIDWKEGIAEYGRLIIDREQVGGGYGVKSTAAALRIAFGIFKLKKIKLEVYADNKYAINCYKNCGFMVSDIDNKNNILHMEVENKQV